MKKGILILMLVLMSIIFVPMFAAASTGPPIMDVMAAIAGYHSTLYTEYIDNMYSNHGTIYINPSMLVIGNENAGGFLAISRVGTAYKIKNENNAGIELAGKVKLVDNGYITSSGNVVIVLS
jgi:hypothetical protein